MKSGSALLNYENPFRPNYDKYSALTWGGFAALSAVGATVTTMPSASFATASLVSGLLALWRAKDAYRHMKKLSHLKGRALSFITLDKLKNNMVPGKVWIGKGFRWTTEHAQFAYELSKVDYGSGTINLGSDDQGSRWLHGMNPTEENLYIPIKHLLGHTLIVGTTGAGKTRLFDLLIAQDILRGEPVIVVDPKGDKELRDNMRRACELAGKADKFVYFHPAFPEESARIDPLCNYNRPTELASRIAALLPSEGGGDTFTAFAHNALDTVIQGMLLANTKPTLIKILSALQGGVEKIVCQAAEAWLSDHFENWKMEVPSKNRGNPEKYAKDLSAKYHEYYKQRKHSLVLENLFNMFKHDREHFGKMVAGLLPILNMLVSGTLGDLLAPDPLANNETIEQDIIDTASIIRMNKVLYIGLDSLSDAIVGSALGSLILSDLCAVAGDTYNFYDEMSDEERATLPKEEQKKLMHGPPVTNIYVDEAAEVINQPTIQMMNKGRGAGFKIAIATQSNADFEARLGSAAKAKQVLGNINNSIALRLRCDDTKQYIVNDLPEVSLKYVMRTQAANTDSGGIEFSGNTGERLMEEKGELFSAAFLGQLPNLEFVSNISGGNFLKGRLPILQLGHS